MKQDQGARPAPGPNPARLSVDHWCYLTQESHRLHVHAVMRQALHRGRLVELNVLHEPDDICCRRESWRRTLDRITAAALAEGPVR